MQCIMYFDFYCIIFFLFEFSSFIAVVYIVSIYICVCVCACVYIYMGTLHCISQLIFITIHFSFFIFVLLFFSLFWFYFYLWSLYVCAWEDVRVCVCVCFQNLKVTCYLLNQFVIVFVVVVVHYHLINLHKTIFG